MVYIIYEIVFPEHLKNIERDGYYTKTEYRGVLVELDKNGVDTRHPSFESAVQEIQQKKEKLKNLKLTILPILQIGWDGEVYTY